MPITKQYLRYTTGGNFNLIASNNCNCVWVTHNNQEGRFICVGTSETITVWDVQLGEKTVVFEGSQFEVTRLVSSPSKKLIVGGYTDGSVRVFDAATASTASTFIGHKKAVTCLAFDNYGYRLASGSKDNHIVVWDIVAENGLARLSGHTAPVTQVQFLKSHNVVVSSSKDTSIKFWDLDTSHCYKTLLGHRTEVWSFTFLSNDNFLVTGCGDSELRVWQCEEKNTPYNFVENMEDNSDSFLSPVDCKKMGSILRSSVGRVVEIVAEEEGNIFAVYGVNDTLELFRILSHLEAQRKMRKRKKKEKKGDSSISSNEAENLSIQDYVKRLPLIKAGGKIKSCSLVQGKGDELRVAVSLSNNTVEIYCLNIESSDEKLSPFRKISQYGHRSEVRALSFSSDTFAIASGSGESVKIWNRASLSCIRTIPCGHVLDVIFVPGDRHLIGALKDGRLLIFDVSVGVVLEEIAAHTGEVWSISLLPNQRGIVSGGGDKTVKFWDFELLQDKSKGKVLSLIHKRTLSLSESVIVVRLSPDSKYIAVALLDMTVKIFFMDSLKFFLNLYGHKLPVTTMDISYDSTILISGSADRNIKIWGLDFGDCHKSIFAHDNSIMMVKFVPDTHQFFSCGKDGSVKQWDADNYNKIITLKGHFGESWTLAVSPNGEHVVSSGSDRALRLYSRTDEPLVLEDEQEEDRAREEEDATLTEGESCVKGRSNLNLPSKKTVDSEVGAEQIIEALDIIKGQVDTDDKLHPLMMAYEVDNSIDLFVETLRRIRSSELEEALLLLPFPSVCEVLELFPKLFKASPEVELLVKTLQFLLKIHHGPISSSETLLPSLTEIQKATSNHINQLRDLIGCNLHGLLFLQRQIDNKDGSLLFQDATVAKNEKTKKNKRKTKALQCAILKL